LWNNDAEKRKLQISALITMHTTELQREVSDGKKLFTRVWKPNDGAPRAVVLITHGMAEHSARYARFAEYLTERQIAAVSYDHRGHGKTGEDHPGYIRSSDGFHLMISDFAEMRTFAEEEFPSLPLFIFAHSMGSFLVQRHLQLQDDAPAGVIYSGSSGAVPALLPVGIILSSAIAMARGGDHRSTLIHNLTFKPYNDHFKPVRTPHDWISRDPDEVELYDNDPLCGFIPSISFYRDFFKGLKRTLQHKPFTAGKYPVMIVSGSHDPVSDMAKGIEPLKQKLIRSGIEELAVKIYPKARHEPLNEINRAEVMGDVYRWIDDLL